MNDHWFLMQCRKEAEDIVCNKEMSSPVKRELLNMIAARIEGFSLNLPGEPHLFREFCSCRDEIRNIRSRIGVL